MFESSLVRKVIDYHNLNSEELEQIVSSNIEVLPIEIVTPLVDFLKEHKVFIAGDYDFDGISSTTLASILCNRLGVEYGYYIPDRIKEGYGTNTTMIKNAYDKGYTHILMVDNGVLAIEAIELAKSLNLKVAIVDHHDYEVTPEVEVFIHPRILPAYFSNMSAGGLMGAILESLNWMDAKALALAGAATIADVMPLKNKNRELVRRAVDLLEREKLPHFDLLVKRNKYTRYTSTLLAFQMVPKINSIGRLSDRANVNTAVQYFLSDDLGLITNYSAQIESLNTLRKEMSKSFKEHALGLINQDPVQIISSDIFHEGLLGIIANQIMQETSKPTIVMKPYEDIYKGSARSNTVSLHPLFKEVDEKFFKAKGGHDFAYGMSVHSSLYKEFKIEVNNIAMNMEIIENIDSYIEISLDEINAQSIEELKLLEPYGEGFKMPAFKVPFPKYTIARLNGYGYKFTLEHPTLKEAVYFTSKSLNTSISYEYMIGTIDISSPYKVSFFIENVI